VQAKKKKDASLRDAAVRTAPMSSMIMSLSVPVTYAPPRRVASVGKEKEHCRMSPFSDNENVGTGKLLAELVLPAEGMYALSCNIAVVTNSFSSLAAYRAFSA
jgi:hypothetical protein